MPKQDRSVSGRGFVKEGPRSPSVIGGALPRAHDQRPRRLRTVDGHVIRAAARAHECQSDQPSRIPAPLIDPSLPRGSPSRPLDTRSLHVRRARRPLRGTWCLGAAARCRCGQRRGCARTGGGVVLRVRPQRPGLVALLAIAVVTAVVYLSARTVAGVGVVVPGLLPPVVAAAAALLLAGGAAPPVAYVAGVLGTLIGAYLLNQHVWQRRGDLCDLTGSQE